MTSRQRVEAALSHREPDRTPVFEYVLLPPIADILLSRKYVGVHARWDEAVAEMGWEQAVAQAARDLVELAVILGHDLLFVPLPPGPLTGTRTRKEDTSSDPVERLRRRNEDAARMGEIPDHRLFIFAQVEKEMERYGVDLPVMASAAGHGIWTDTDLMETMLLAPDVAQEHFRLATRRCLSLAAKYASFRSIAMVQVGGDVAGRMPLVSPEAYRSFIVPEVRTVSRAVRRSGRAPVNASDGNLWPVLDDFLFGCEVDGYCEIDFSAGMTLEKLKTVCRGKIALIGNLDCGTVLSFGTPETVRRHVEECLDAGWADGGHILCASNAITSSVPLENYLAAVNAYRARFHLSEFYLDGARRKKRGENEL